MAFEKIIHYLFDEIPPPNPLDIQIQHAGPDDIVQLVAILPWQKFRELLQRCTELKLEYTDTDQFDELEQLREIKDSVVLPSMMTKILDDPAAPLRLKKKAQEFALQWKERDDYYAHHPPGPGDERAHLVRNGISYWPTNIPSHRKFK